MLSVIMLDVIMPIVVAWCHHLMTFIIRKYLGLKFEYVVYIQMTDRDFQAP
jgi:hypothetical protein